MESNHYKIKLHFQTSSFSLDISQLCQKHFSSLFFMTFKIFPKCSHRICLNFAIIDATKGGTSSLKRFVKKLLVLLEIKRKVKNLMASLRCHGNSDVNKTWIITDDKFTNFHLYLVQLVKPLAEILISIC